jgi:hypothetical protein
MALLPSGIIVGTTGNSNTPTEQIGGVALGITSATTTTTGSPLTRTLTLLDTAMDGNQLRRSVPIEASGINHAYSATKAYVGGTFAYNQSQFMVRTVATQINGVANTAIRFNGTEPYVARTYVTNSSKGAKTSTAWRAGYFSFMRISGQRSNWTTAPSSNDVNYVLPTNSGSASVDQAQYVTYKSIPGELTYMYGALNAKTDDYKAATGG